MQIVVMTVLTTAPGATRRIHWLEHRLIGERCLGARSWSYFSCSTEIGRPNDNLGGRCLW